MNYKLELSAFHEMGHVIMAYLMGFQVNNVKLYENGEGSTSINYGLDSDVCKAILLLPDTSEMNSLFQNNRPNIVLTIRRFFYMLCAGIASEALYHGEKDTDGKLVAEADRTDLSDVQRGEELLVFMFNRYPKDFPRSYFDDTMSEVGTMLNITAFSQAITLLVGKATRSKDYKIDNSQIEEILDACGYLGFAAKYSSLLL
jgi:hypothetical protein